MKRIRFRGFSLIELLIALAIVAILASITVPSFSGLIAKSRRGDAMVALLSVQLAQESFRASHSAYANDLGKLGWQSAASPDGHYRLSVHNAGQADFLAVARPVGLQRSDKCGAFAMDAEGPHFSSGYAGRHCWSR